MKNLDRRLIACWCCFLAIPNLMGQASGPSSDMICGPRCLDYLLYWYDMEEDLSDLMWELQNGRFEEPVSLRHLSDALSKRGIYSRAVEIQTGATLTWSYPVIVHMTHPQTYGHFIVWIPPNESHGALYWLGLSGFTAKLSEESQNRLSGIVLLTAPSPIIDISTAARKPILDWENYSISLVLVVLVTGLVGWYIRRRFINPQCC
jgi:hypothetical protein